MAETPILINKLQDMENSPPHQTTPVSDSPTQPPYWWEVAPSEQELRMFLIMLIGACLNNLCLCYCVYNLMYTMINVFHFIITVFKN